ncbi:LysM peptidoglycan-binding domain-containing protein [Histidinibacterium lentulum]|uniref:LysM domain-containing protein n=1 Tax=Histidinibacterium lentulum TaxID=2480588 RepID=A0A3N2QRR5_9RHOB|nr:LysM peptidoglycan-binding domain-containing protein [Histidinibacterium lentulum]ROT97715.1 LysM domain-containing protein [Histidinibacterium lentulum]
MRRATPLLGLCLVIGTGPAGAEGVCGDTYRVKPGDRLADIADTCGVPLAQLYELNVIASPSGLSPGAVLRLRPGEPATNGHEVRPGDTVRSVAELHDVSVPALLAENGLDPTPELVPGMELIIPGDDGAPPEEDGGRVLTGTISRGVECPILTTAEGTVWSLAGEIPQEAMGREARVTGTLAEMSFCMQGDGTLNVEQVELPEAE